MDEAPVWERSKENTAPLERGRNVTTLERMVQQPQPQPQHGADEAPAAREDKARMIRHYERLVQPSEQHGDSTERHDSNGNNDDPLIHWLSYIKFHQDAFPADTHAQFLLMERCTRALVRRTQYANDVRFIRVCVTYADKTSFPGDVFKFLHQQRVGARTALFWIAWAWVAENRGDYAFAEKVFLKGIAKDAKPLNVLKQRHKQFQRRMSRHWLSTNESGIDGDGDLDNAEDTARGRRGALGALSDEAARANDRRSGRVVSSRRPEQSSGLPTFVDRSATVGSRPPAPADNGAAPKEGFQIFVDENAENHVGYDLDQSHSMHHESRDMMEREEDRRKENEAAAERWNDRGGLERRSASTAVAASAPQPPSAPAFDVFVDEECAAQLRHEKEEKKNALDAARSVRDERTLRYRSDEGVAERLTRDPMRYVRNPSKLADDQRGQQDQQRKPQGMDRGQTKEKSGSLACGFNKRLVAKDASGQEQCFEEGRAKARNYTFADPCSNMNLLAFPESAAPTTDDSTMDIDDTQSFDMAVASENEKDRKRPHSSSSSGVPPTHKSMPKKVLFVGDTSMDSQNTHVLNTSTASSTINERHAVGAVTGREEETINTKFALKELSMMFSSPALGLHDSAQPARKSRQSSETGSMVHDIGDGDTATFSLVAGLIDDSTPGANDNSIIGSTGSEANNNENCAPHNPLARTNVTHDLDGSALQPLEFDEVPLAQSLRESTDGGFAIYCDEDAKPIPTESTATKPFEVYDEPSNQCESAGDGDTATFSLVGKTLEVLAEAKHAPAPTTEGFSVYVDEDSLVGDLKTFDNGRALTDAPDFGDISRIVPSDADATTTGRLSVLAPPNHAIDYERLHKNSIRAALRQIQYEARELALSGSSSSKNPDLSFMLSSKGYIYDMPTLSLPRAFHRKSSVQGSEITIGDKTGVVREELGRGSYGVVVLMDLTHKPDTSAMDYVAVKAQTPTDCLALEYLTLKKIEERVGSHQRWSEPRVRFPFPKALSFVSLADGALFGMTAGSRSGLNLVDLVNFYQLSERTSVPELIALHYTARMLSQLEMLHWHGKILHADVKPDNWVLMASTVSFKTCHDLIDGSDLMLVDFGRAVDLMTAASAGIDPMDVKLLGDASGEDMSCVAARQGLGWSFDADTYGLCASAYVLLYGSHMEVEEDHSTRRWKPRKPLRRYWQKEIWEEVFQTLLNLDDVTGNAIGSRSRSLHSLRIMIEDHLNDRGRELESLLRHQARILPASRTK